MEDEGAATTPKADKRLSEAEIARRRRQRMRSIALGLVLAGLAVLFFVVTIVRLGGQVGNRPL